MGGFAHAQRISAGRLRQKRQIMIRQRKAVFAGDALKISAGILEREVAEGDRFTGEQTRPEEEKGACGQEGFDDGDE